MSDTPKSPEPPRPHVSFVFHEDYTGKPADDPFDELGEYDLGIGKFQRRTNKDDDEYSYSSDEPDVRPANRPYKKQLPG